MGKINCFRRCLPLILILVVGGIIYANTFQVPYILDDKPSIVRNVVIKDLGNFFENTSGYELLPGRSAAYLSFALNYHFSGLDVTGYHIVNLIIHILNAFLVYALLSATFATPYFRTCFSFSSIQIESQTSFFADSTRWHNFLPLMAALIFVSHPVQTQAVTYIVQRMTSLATLFYLLSFLFYIQMRLRIVKGDFHTPVTRGETAVAGEEVTSFGTLRPKLIIALLVIGSVLTAVLAMLTKPIAFTLPFAAMLYEIYFFRGSIRSRLMSLLPLLATLPIVPLTIIGLSGVTEDNLSDTADQFRVGGEISRSNYLITQFRVIVTYLRLLILPINQNLDYDYPVYKSFFTPSVFSSFLLLTVIFVVAVYIFHTTRWAMLKVAIHAKAEIDLDLDKQQLYIHNRQQSLTTDSSRKQSTALSTGLWRLVSFGILWFFLTLSVESSFVPIRDVIFEHRLYLPSFGASAAFAALFYLSFKRFCRTKYKGAVVVFGLLLIMVLSFATYQRNQTWENAVRLWQDVVEKSPNKGRPLNNLGVALEESGRRNEAFLVLSRAIEVDPAYYKSYYNLADLYLVNDQPGNALPLLQSAIRLHPDFTLAYVKYGAALMRGGQFQDVVSFLQQNFDIVREDPEARFYLGAAHAFLGNRPAAMRELEYVSRFDSRLAASLKNLLSMQSNHGISNGH